MGVGVSDLGWGQTETFDHDMWGAKADMNPPTQQIWSEYYQVGFPTLGRGELDTTSYPKLLGVPPVVGVPAQTKDRLETFGGNLGALQIGKEQKMGNSVWCTGPGGARVPCGAPYAEVQGGGWGDGMQCPIDQNKSSPNYGLPRCGNVCTPDNYPYCNMKEWHEKAPQVVQWNMAPWTGVISNYDPAKPRFGYAPRYVLSTYNSGPTGGAESLNLMQPWEKAIEDLVASFKSGNFTSLSEVNQEDTRTWDPCNKPSFFSEVLPLVAAGFAAFFVRLIDLSPIIGAGPETVGVASVAMMAYHAGEYLLAEGDGIWSGDKTREEQLKVLMATDLLVGGATVGGLVIGPILYNFLLDNTDYNLDLGPTQALVGVSIFFAGRTVFTNFILQQLKIGGIGALPIAFLLSIVKGIGKLACRIGNWGQQTCYGTDEEEFQNKHPNTRLWDVGSIAALLAQDAAEQEGWALDDPRTEFVFRGLITGPAMMWAGTSKEDMPGLYREHTVNPLGLIMPVEQMAYQSSNHVGAYNVYNARMSSWTGDYDDLSWGVGQYASRYACQNFTTLLRGDEEGSDPTDAIVAQRLKAWRDQLTERAKDPNNLVQQVNIPYLYSGGLKAPKISWYDWETFIKTCSEDQKEPPFGTGFNTVQARGEYAQMLAQDPPESPTSQWTELLANEIFAATDLATGWQSFAKIWNKSNLTALAHYVYAPKGEQQQGDFETFFVNDDTTVSDYLANHPTNPGFSADPTLPDGGGGAQIYY